MNVWFENVVENNIPQAKVYKNILSSVSDALDDIVDWNSFTLSKSKLEEEIVSWLSLKLNLKTKTFPSRKSSNLNVAQSSSHHEVIFTTRDFFSLVDIVVKHSQLVFNDEHVLKEKSKRDECRSELHALLDRIDPRKVLSKYKEGLICPKCHNNYYVKCIMSQTRRPDEIMHVEYHCVNPVHAHAISFSN